MTTTKQLLGLAMAVYPDSEWKMDGGLPYRMVRTDRYEIFAPHGDERQYSMAMHQFCDVLAWLLRKGVVIYPASIVWKCDFQHDGTADGLRQAVTDAAVRVMGVDG